MVMKLSKLMLEFQEMFAEKEVYIFYNKNFKNISQYMKNKSWKINTTEDVKHSWVTTFCICNELVTIEWMQNFWWVIFCNCDFFFF
jgi:hypothetical protein